MGEVGGLEVSVDKAMCRPVDPTGQARRRPWIMDLASLPDVNAFLGPLVRGSGDEQLPRGERETRPTFSVRGYHQVLGRLDRGDFSVGRGPKIHAAVREREPKLLSTPWGMAISDGNVGTVSILRTGSQAETSSQRTARGARSETPLPNLNGHPGTEQGGGSGTSVTRNSRVCVPSPMRKRVHRASSRRAAARTSLPN